MTPFARVKSTYRPLESTVIKATCPIKLKALLKKLTGWPVSVKPDSYITCVTPTQSCLAGALLLTFRFFIGLPGRPTQA